MPVTFTKVGTRVTVNDNGKIIGLRGTLNVFPHPTEESIVITGETSDVGSINGLRNAMIYKIADITTPSAADKQAMVTALQSVFS